MITKVKKGHERGEGVEEKFVGCAGRGGGEAVLHAYRSREGRRNVVLYHSQCQDFVKSMDSGA